MHPPRFAHALSLLLQSYHYALELSCDSCDLAVEREELPETGLSNSDLRWLLSKGYVLQAAELIPPPDGRRRSFAIHATLVLGPRSCFILTSDGVGFAAGGETRPAPPDAAPRESIAEARAPSGVFPNNGTTRMAPAWDKDRRLLRLGGCTVKHFKVPAANQEIILAVFEEEGWPPRIDDPLPLTASIDPKRRLRDTINSLNRNQRETLLRFLGDGNAEGVCWEAANTLQPGGSFHGESPRGVASNGVEEFSGINGRGR